MADYTSIQDQASQIVYLQLQVKNKSYRRRSKGQSMGLVRYII